MIIDRSVEPTSDEIFDVLEDPGDLCRVAQLYLDKYNAMTDKDRFDVVALRTNAIYLLQKALENERKNAGILPPGE